MMFTVRKLTEEDLSQAEHIYVSHDRVQRSEIQRTKEEFALLVENKSTFLGAFDGDTLVAFLTYRFLVSLPCMIISNIYLKQGQFQTYYFKNENHPLPSMIDFVLAEAEEKKYYTWFYTRANLPIYNKLEEKGQDLLRNTKFGYDKEKSQYRYERFIEEVIPPKSQSQSSVYNTYLGLGNFDTSVILLKCCLKNEYRKWE
jgi:hypothetical protein